MFTFWNLALFAPFGQVHLRNCNRKGCQHTSGSSQHSQFKDKAKKNTSKFDGGKN
jgi:hypothetical protein